MYKVLLTTNHFFWQITSLRRRISNCSIREYWYEQLIKKYFKIKLIKPICIILKSLILKTLKAKILLPKLVDWFIYSFRNGKWDLERWNWKKEEATAMRGRGGRYRRSISHKLQNLSCFLDEGKYKLKILIGWGHRQLKKEWKGS
jgi:hypothetical protein